MEGRLKLLELIYIPAIAYPAGESKHGFISLVEEGFPVVFVAHPDETHRKMVGNIMEMKARGARVISIIQEGDTEIKELSDDSVEIPGILPSLVFFFQAEDGIRDLTVTGVQTCALPI